MLLTSGPRDSLCDGPERALDLARAIGGTAGRALAARAQIATALPAKRNSLAIDCDRISDYLEKGMAVPPSQGLKSLLRHARRSGENQAIKRCRERVAQRGRRSWASPGSAPRSFLGFEIAALSTTQALMDESREVGNCVADLEEPASEGHYLVFSLRRGERERHTAVIAAEADGTWSVYAVEDRRKYEMRDAKDTAQHIADALTEAVGDAKDEGLGTATKPEPPIKSQDKRR